MRGCTTRITGGLLTIPCLPIGPQMSIFLVHHREITEMGFSIASVSDITGTARIHRAASELMMVRYMCALLQFVFIFERHMFGANDHHTIGVVGWPKVVKLRRT